MRQFIAEDTWAAEQWVKALDLCSIQRKQEFFFLSEKIRVKETQSKSIRKWWVKEAHKGHAGNTIPWFTGSVCLRKTRKKQNIRWHWTPVLLAGKSHGRRSLVGCSPWSREESDTTEWLHFRFSLSCIGEGNGNPLQCSCLENPRDAGTWWATVYGVIQSRTRLKRLGSSSRHKEARYF